MSLRLGIVADDLSGGVAVGGELSGRGFRALAFDGAAVVSQAHQVAILDTASRYAPAAESAAATEQAFRRLRAAGARLFGKKIDSLLRGNPGAEIMAGLAALDEPCCLVAPASPRYGRVTVGGHQLVLGEPPVYEDLRRVLREQTGEEVAVLSLDIVMRGEAAVAAALPGLMKRHRIVVADAVNQAQLNLVVRGAADLGTRFFAGTYGLGEALAGVLGSGSVGTLAGVLGSGSVGTPAAESCVADGRPVVVVAGSYSPVTRQQVQHAGAAGATVIAVDCIGILSESVCALAAHPAAALAEALDQGRDVVLHTAASPADVDRIHADARAAGLAETALAGRIGALLAAVLDSGLEGRTVSGLVMTGGETARSLYNHWGATALELGAELIPASPLCRMVGGARHGLPFVTKPGAYGDPDALTALIRDLKAASAAGRE